MSRVYSLLMLLALAAAAALPAAAAPRAPAPRGDDARVPIATGNRPAALDPEFMGMAIRDPWYEFNTNPQYPDAANQAFQDVMGETLARAGVRWVRLEFHIPYNASVSDPCDTSCQWEIAKNDYFITTVAPRYNLKVLAMLGFGVLRNTDACGLNDPHAVTSHFGGGVNRYMDVWLTRALRIADRYQEQIAAYEILNEQNRLPLCGIPSKLYGKALNAIDPRIVGRLITKFYRFCHGIDVPLGEPTHGCAAAQIILGGLHPRGSSAPGSSQTSLFDTQYLTAIYTDTTSFAGFFAAHPTIGYPVDGVGYHPYPQEIRLSPNDEQVDRGMTRMRLALESVGDPFKPFWVTEVGYNVGFDIDGPKNPIPPQTEQGQAAFMLDVYTTLSARRLANDQPEVANVFWFKYEDFPPATGPNAQQWGIVRIPMLSDAGCEGGCYDPSGVPSSYRQSFWTYRELAGLPVYRTYLSAIQR